MIGGRWKGGRTLSGSLGRLRIVPEFVELAQRRLPQWADRICVGNIRTWQPPYERFDFVLIRPIYAPVNRRGEMVEHILSHVLKPNGRLIVLGGTEEIGSRDVELSITSQGLPVHGRVEIPHGEDARVVRRLFWIDGSDLFV